VVLENKNNTKLQIHGGGGGGRTLFLPGRAGGHPAAAAVHLPATGAPGLPALARRCQQAHHGDAEPRAKPLIWDDGGAFVIDDLSSTRPYRALWTDKGSTYLIGTCNGLLCICDNAGRAGGSLTVSNPATRETRPVPPLPCARLFVGHIYGELSWDQAYSFAYHPVTGKYKVLHVPWSRDRLFDFQNVQVLTLWDTTWREVRPRRRRRQRRRRDALGQGGRRHQDRVLQSRRRVLRFHHHAVARAARS
jgi:hypothetical protein